MRSINRPLMNAHFSSEWPFKNQSKNRFSRFSNAGTASSRRVAPLVFAKAGWDLLRATISLKLDGFISEETVGARQLASRGYMANGRKAGPMCTPLAVPNILADGTMC